MDTSARIIEYVQQRGEATGRELCQLLGISRQALNKHLKELIRAGRVVMQGSTRGARYCPASAGAARRRVRRLTRSYALAGLQEDQVFQDLAAFLDLRTALDANALDIARYAFTEMLNNAIDHSESERGTVEVEVDAYELRFRIRDFGVGVFHSIYRKFSLADENAAIGELLKGKTTTKAERHSGEGIFFASKAADLMAFRSHRARLVFDNEKGNAFVEQVRFATGTEVAFRIRRRSRRRLSEVFAAFAPEEFDYKFQRTRALVKLCCADCVSRSQARRLLHGLDRFTEVVLDFRGVRTLGQAFADEVFRVFPAAHPGVVLKTENVAPTLEPMLRHVVDNSISSRLTIG